MRNSRVCRASRHTARTGPKTAPCPTPRAEHGDDQAETDAPPMATDDEGDER